MSSLIRVSTKQVITPQAPTPGLDVQYPFQWFQSHPGKKPLLNVTLVCSDLKTARGMMMKAIHLHSVPLPLAVTFLYYYAETLRSGPLSDPWVSYNIKIGEAGSSISPLDLFEVQTNIAVRNFETMETEEVHDGWMACYALSIYRLIRANIGDYKNSITEKVNMQLKAINGNAQEATDVVDLYLGWMNDQGYNALVAGYDMYFNKFRNHAMANVRVGTTGSRYRDCAGIMSYGYVTTLLGMKKMTELMDWVFIEQVGDDIDRMMRDEDEINDKFSYFPYQVDMGLVIKSAYSATANPHFFEWVHIIGTLLRSVRSMNARHLKWFKYFYYLL